MTKSKRARGAAADFGFALPTTVGIVNHDPTRLRAPGYSFGTRPHEKNRAVGPGPHYKVDTALTPRGTGYSPSFSITGRPRRTVWDSMTSKGPSPNTYNTPASNRMSASWEKAAPMYSFGGPFRGQKKPAVPAPNTYRIPGTIGSHAPDLKASGPSSTLYGKGAESKGFSHDFAKTPGPAKYDPVDLTHTQRRAPAVTMKRRTKLPSNDPVTPGPAAYDPSNLEKYNKSGPRVTALRAHYSDSLRPPLFTMTDVSI